MNYSHEINLSAHGYQRLIERTNCKPKNALIFLGQVWETGKTLESYDKKSPIFKYLSNVLLNGGYDRALRVKGNTLFLFNRAGLAFITCYEIPQKVLQDKHGNHKRIRYYDEF